MTEREKTILPPPPPSLVVRDEPRTRQNVDRPTTTSRPPPDGDHQDDVDCINCNHDGDVDAVDDIWQNRRTLLLWTGGD